MSIREPEAIDEGLVELVESLDPNPAYVAGGRWDILHANRAAHLLFADFDSRRGHERNMLWYYLAEPAARALYVDWEAEAIAQLGHFREDYEKWPGDPRFDDLLERVFAVTPQARTWWEERRGVDLPRNGVKQIRLADGRLVSLRQLVMSTVDDPEIQVVCYFADIDDDGDYGDDMESLLGD